MKKRMVWVLMLVFILGTLALTGCGGSSNAPADGGDGSQYTAENPLVIRISFLNAPSDSSVQSGKKWEEMLEEKSEGRIDLQVFPSGELGGARENFQAMQDGTLEMASLIPGTVAGFDARFELSSLPGLFTSAEQAAEFDRNGFIGEEMDKFFEEKGVIRLVKGEPNFYNFFTTEKAGAIGSIAELKGKKLRITESPMLKTFMENAGGVPTPMPWGEIYTSLQRNVIDGTIGNLIWSVAAKFHEVATVIDQVNVQYTPSDWFMSKKAWDQMPKDLQDIILESIPELQEFAQNNWMQEEEKNRAELATQGVKIIVPTLEEQKQWSAECYPLWKDYAVATWGQEMVDRIEKEIFEIQ